VILNFEIRIGYTNLEIRIGHKYWLCQPKYVTELPTWGSFSPQFLT